MIETYKTLIIQRVLPHYRLPLFQKIFDRYGVRVVTSETVPQNAFLNLANPHDHKWAIPTKFVYPNSMTLDRVVVPVDWIFNKFKPHSVIAEFGLRISSSYSLPWKRRTGALQRLAFWSHGWQMGRSEVGVSNRLVQYARLPLFAAADVLATYSEEGAGWVRRHLPWKRVISLGNTIDIEAIRRIGAIARPSSFGSPQLISVGRLTNDKRVDRAIEVVRLLLPRFPNIALSIIGDGPELSRLKSLVDPSISPHVKFIGSIYKEEDLAPHFLGADIFIVTGAAGLSVNHSLAYGLPVAAFARSRSGPYHHPEIEYVVPGHSGILVEPYTTVALADQIASLLLNERLESLRQTTRTFADDAMGLELMVRRFGNLLHELDPNSILEE